MAASRTATPNQINPTPRHFPVLLAVALFLAAFLLPPAAASALVLPPRDAGTWSQRNHHALERLHGPGVSGSMRTGILGDVQPVRAAP